MDENWNKDQQNKDQQTKDGQHAGHKESLQDRFNKSSNKFRRGRRARKEGIGG